MDFPKKYGPVDAPSEVLKLTERLVPLLIEGDHPALSALGHQFLGARIKQVELTGAGFYVDFEVSPDAPLAAEPSDFAGGYARITLKGARKDAGCVLFVRGGRLVALEGYTYGDDAWLENTVILSVENVVPVDPG